MSKKEIALIARWDRKTTDTTTKLLALSCFDQSNFARGGHAFDDDILSFQSLSLEVTVEIIDLLHEFCFFFRKLIERTDQIADAKKLVPHSAPFTVKIGCGGVDERDIKLCQKDLWWILGRVMHSKSVMILGGDQTKIHVYHDGKIREYDNNRCYVEVASDKDKLDVAHVVHIPSLVSTYTSSYIGHHINKVAQELK